MKNKYMPIQMTYDMNNSLDLTIRQCVMMAHCGNVAIPGSFQKRYDFLCNLYGLPKIVVTSNPPSLQIINALQRFSLLDDSTAMPPPSVPLKRTGSAKRKATNPRKRSISECEVGQRTSNQSIKIPNIDSFAGKSVGTEIYMTKISHYDVGLEIYKPISHPYKENLTTKDLAIGLQKGKYKATWVGNMNYDELNNRLMNELITFPTLYHVQDSIFDLLKNAGEGRSIRVFTKHKKMIPYVYAFDTSPLISTKNK